MSSCNTTRITCPKCQNQQDFTIWNSVNVDLDSTLKDRLLSGKLTRFTCDKCSQSTEITYPLLYHDMTRKLMVNFVTNKETTDLSASPFGAMLKGYQLRIVTSRNQLLEKIWIAEAGLDDRAMELFKISLFAQIEAAANDELLFAGEDRNANGTHLAKFALVTPGGVEPITIHIESYTDFADSITEMLEMEPAKFGEWLHINRDYSLALMKKYTSNGFD